MVGRLIFGFFVLVGLAFPLEGRAWASEHVQADEAVSSQGTEAPQIVQVRDCPGDPGGCASHTSQLPACPTFPSAACGIGTALPAGAAAVALPPADRGAATATAYVLAPLQAAPSLFRPPRA